MHLAHYSQKYIQVKNTLAHDSSAPLWSKEATSQEKVSRPHTSMMMQIQLHKSKPDTEVGGWSEDVATDCSKCSVPALGSRWTPQWFSSPHEIKINRVIYVLAGQINYQMETSLRQYHSSWVFSHKIVSSRIPHPPIADTTWLHLASQVQCPAEFNVNTIHDMWRGINFSVSTSLAAAARRIWRNLCVWTKMVMMVGGIKHFIPKVKGCVTLTEKLLLPRCESVEMERS